MRSLRMRFTYDLAGWEYMSRIIRIAAVITIAALSLIICVGVAKTAGQGWGMFDAVRGAGAALAGVGVVLWYLDRKTILYFVTQLETYASERGYHIIAPPEAWALYEDPVAHIKYKRTTTLLLLLFFPLWWSCFGTISIALAGSAALIFVYVIAGSIFKWLFMVPIVLYQLCSISIIPDQMGLATGVSAFLGFISWGMALSIGSMETAEFTKEWRESPANTHGLAGTYAHGLSGILSVAKKIENSDGELLFAGPYLNLQAGFLFGSLLLTGFTRASTQVMSATEGYGGRADDDDRPQEGDIARGQRVDSDAVAEALAIRMNQNRE